MNVIRTVLPIPGGLEFVYTTKEGHYLGRTSVLAIDGEAMGIMAKDVCDFHAEQKAAREKPKIAIAVGDAIRRN